MRVKVVLYLLLKPEIVSCLAPAKGCRDSSIESSTSCSGGLTPKFGSELIPVEPERVKNEHFLAMAKHAK